LSTLFLGFLFMILIFISIISPGTALQSASASFSMFLTIILPSLFPFMLIMDLILKSKVIYILSFLFKNIMGPIFNLPGASSLGVITGFISGYPGGAIAATSLREDGYITKAEGERLISFCNNASPIFITGAIGAGLLKNPSLGIILLKSHVISAICVGIIFRFLIKDPTITRPFHSLKTSSPSFLTSPKKLTFHKITVTDVTLSILKCFKTLAIVCGYMVLFSVLVGIIKEFNLVGAMIQPFKIQERDSLFSSIICGFVELSGGIQDVATQKLPTRTTLSLISLLLGWGSLSIHLQTISILQKTDLRWKTYILGKLLHGLISALYTWTMLTL
jgi:sporulation integral membrane protein YlbJ